VETFEGFDTVYFTAADAAHDDDIADDVNQRAGWTRGHCKLIHASDHCSDRQTDLRFSHVTPSTSCPPRIESRYLRQPVPSPQIFLLQLYRGLTLSGAVEIPSSSLSDYYAGRV